MSQKKWLPAEIEILHEYAFAPMREIVEKLPNRTSKTIYWKLGLLGFQQEMYKRYTKDEDQYILQNFTQLGNRAMAKVLLRSEKSVVKRMFILGISRSESELSAIRANNTHCFKKGHSNKKKMPNGNIQLVYNQKKEKPFYNIKVGSRFKRLSRYLYEQYHGVVLKRTDIIYHADGDAMNILKENLVLLNRKDLLLKNINTDEAFVGRIFRIKDKALIDKMIDQKPELIAMKRNQIKLQSKISQNG